MSSDNTNSVKQSRRNNKQVYHLTKLANLPSIIRHGLMSRADLSRSHMSFADVADPEIIAERQGQSLEIFVPFHFVSRSPFDYAVVNREPNEDYLVLGVDREFARSNGWLVFPRHPLSWKQPPVEWDEGLAAIDWDRIDKGGDWKLDNDLQQSMMAEALSPATVLIGDIATIFVSSDAMKATVSGMISGRNPYVLVNPRIFPPNGRR
ncbi:MAG: DUF4433 domain-containing protein [Deltaproteobacteria bacterium]|nr:DUF4433 domain-containing protein [Deltaproteobacteria bacterium]